MTRRPKKLIEVALPLDAINAAAAREKSIRHGHPSTLHLWWARRPLAAARAVIFAQMVDDPSEYVDELLSDPDRQRAARRALKRHRADAAVSAVIGADAAGSGSVAADAGPARTADRRALGGIPVAAPTTPTPPAAGTADRRALGGMAAALERERLFGILEELVRWENTTNEEVLARARAEIRRSWRRTCSENEDHPRAAELFDPDRLPAFHDPFAGGGALPLEAQRLGLEAHASDLNPVAVLINKAMIEIPPRFAGRPPVNPAARADRTVVAKTWRGAQGLAEDVRHYGRWMRDEAEKRIGPLYPPVEITPEMVRERPDLKPYEGRKLTVIAWLWARTVKSPNPAFADVDVPLASTFMLSTKKGKEAYVEPVIEGKGYRFSVRVGPPADRDAAKLGTTAGKRHAFRCVMSGVPVTYNHVRAEGKEERIGARLMAIVAEGDRSRIYLSPTSQHEAIAGGVSATWRPDMPLPDNPRDFKTPNYGLPTFADLFTSRQLIALTTLSDVVGEATERVRRDAMAAGLPDADRPLHDGGTGTTAYAQAVALYLAFAIDKTSDYGSTICTWHSSKELIRNTFSRQAIPMTWDFAETNTFSASAGNALSGIEWAGKILDQLCPIVHSYVVLDDSQNQVISVGKIVSTDPPYYDNIGYADLSDFFYVWLRRSLKPVFPELFATLVVPKTEELVATPYRHGSKQAAEAFFLNGMTQALRQLSDQAHPGFRSRSTTLSSSRSGRVSAESPAPAGKRSWTP